MEKAPTAKEVLSGARFIEFGHARFSMQGSSAVTEASGLTPPSAAALTLFEEDEEMLVDQDIEERLTKLEHQVRDLQDEVKKLKTTVNPRKAPPSAPESGHVQGGW